MNQAIIPTEESVSKIHQETNQRMFDRNIPGQPLQPHFSVRPVNTKYTVLPIVEPRTKPQTKAFVYPVYQPQKTFNPGNTKGPWSGFSSNVNNESILRNQVFALQRANQSVYVPASNSDLYFTRPFKDSQQQQQPFPDLFEQPHFSSHNPNPDGIASNQLFLNSTRLEYRDMIVDNTCQNK